MISNIIHETAHYNCLQQKPSVPVCLRVGFGFTLEGGRSGGRGVVLGRHLFVLLATINIQQLYRLIAHFNRKTHNKMA